jgi:hypothetical protein
MLSVAALAGSLSASAQAGDFTESQDILGRTTVSFSGPVEFGDADNLERIMRGLGGHAFTLEIETPGGMAVEGISMCDMITSYPGTITTVAVGSGAWSAGAMMWIGGDITTIQTGSVVGFHLAYIPGCRGCDTAGINGIIGGVIARASFRCDANRWPGTMHLLIDMAVCRDEFGPQGFVMYNHEGRKDIGQWWDFYPDAAELLDEGDNHVGRARRNDTEEPGDSPEQP